MTRPDQTRPDQLIVSFCIPVYNNAEAARKIVEGLLVSDDERFEVVVCDDASTDNAEELLYGIKDKRFRYCRNEKNLGAHKNWLHTLELGRGEWLYLVMGRDKLYGENIGRVIELLECARQNNITCLKDRTGGEFCEYRGIDAMISFVRSDHPTGLIFSREKFLSVPKRHYYIEIPDMYREAYIEHDLLFMGGGAYINSGVYKIEVVTDTVEQKSTVENGIDIDETFYAPPKRTAHFFRMIDLIDSDNIFTHDDKDKYFCERFRALLSHVSLTLRAYCKNPQWQAHYGQKVRHIGMFEMIRNIFRAHRESIKHLKEKGSYTVARKNIMRKNVVKYIAHSSAKAFLEFCGVKFPRQ